MRAFSAHLLERGAASLEALEASIELMVLHGSELGTNLLDAGVLREGSLVALLADHHGMAAGPVGRLPAPGEELVKCLPPEDALRFHVFPLALREEGLELAVDRPLSDHARLALEARAGKPLRCVVVSSLRLDEALFRHAGGGLSERDRWLLAMLNAGHQPRRGDRERFARHVVEKAPSHAPYRRMSEHPEGIARSSRQPEPHLPDPDVLKEELEDSLSETLDGSGPSTRPYETISVVPGSEPPEKRITQPYADGEEAERRDTQPWRDGGEEEVPLSVQGEFNASLSAEVPPSEDARIHEEHRRFRHRGPFTRAQAELAASQASDVDLVLEILVRYARQYFERSILFVVSSGELELRLSYGLTADLASLRVSLSEPGLITEAYRKGDPIVWSLGHEGSDAMLRRRLGLTGEQSVAVVPLCIRERVVAVFYGDDRSDDVDTVAVEDVTDFTEVCAAEITRVIIARKRRRDEA